MKDPKSLFLRVVEAGSFKKAATQLNVEPSTISRKVAALESELNVKLLNRSTLHSTPTELGQIYYDRLRSIIDEQEALDEEITSGLHRISGSLRIGAPVDFGAEFVVPVCRDLQIEYPELTMEMSLGSHFDNLLENKLDVAIRIGKLPDSRLVACKLGDISRVIVASPEYLRLNGVPQSLSDLSQHNFIFYSPKQARSDIEFENGSVFPHTTMHSNFTVNSVSALRNLVIKGAGLHLGPTWFFSEAIRNGDAEVVLQEHPLRSFPAYAVYLDRSFLPRKIKVFIEKMKERVKTIE